MGQKPFCWGGSLSEVGHLWVFSEREKPKKARAAAEAAAEQGGSGLAHPEDTREHTRGKTHWGMEEERSRRFRGDGEVRQG